MFRSSIARPDCKRGRLCAANRAPAAGYTREPRRVYPVLAESPSFARPAGDTLTEDEADKGNPGTPPAPGRLCGPVHGRGGGPQPRPRANAGEQPGPG